MKCCAIKSSNLNRQVKILRRSDTPDAMGGVVESWGIAATLWAMVKPMSASERAYAGRIEATADYKVIVRFSGDAQRNPSYTPDDRLEYQGLEYGIVSVVDVENARQWLEIGVRSAQ